MRGNILFFHNFNWSTKFCWLVNVNIPICPNSTLFHSFFMSKFFSFFMYWIDPKAIFQNIHDKNKYCHRNHCKNTNISERFCNKLNNNDFSCRKFTMITIVHAIKTFTFIRANQWTTYTMTMT